jgi:hypothetical protein
MPTLTDVQHSVHKTENSMRYLSRISGKHDSEFQKSICIWLTSIKLYPSVRQLAELVTVSKKKRQTQCINENVNKVIDFHLIFKENTNDHVHVRWLTY